MFAHTDLKTATDALARLPLEHLLLPILVQLVVILTAARFFGVLFHRFGQPAVVGEILAGILLGPSLFGTLFPDAFRALFYPAIDTIPDDLSSVIVSKIFAILAQVGLILLLFQVGMEFDFEHLRGRRGAAFGIMAVGMAVPFALGAGLAPLIHPLLEAHPRTGEPVPITGMMLFIGSAFAISALPVLARLMMDFGILHTRLATVTITAAALGDAVGWILLATVAAIAQSAFSLDAIFAMIGATLAFLSVMQFAVRPLAIRYFQKALSNRGELNLTGFTVLLVLVLLASLVTNIIGLFAIFGAFVLGAVLSDQPMLRLAVRHRLRDLIVALFVPIYFVSTGLRAEFQSLGSSELWLVAAAVVAVAFAGKLLSCGITARFTGFGTREATIIGTLLNVRGVLELIIINVGYDLGVIPRSLFCMLVLMVMLSNLLPGPVLRWVSRGTELEGVINNVGPRPRDCHNITGADR